METETIIISDSSESEGPLKSTLTRPRTKHSAQGPSTSSTHVSASPPRKVVKNVTAGPSSSRPTCHGGHPPRPDKTLTCSNPHQCISSLTSSWCPQCFTEFCSKETKAELRTLDEDSEWICPQCKDRCLCVRCTSTKSLPRYNKISMKKVVSSRSTSNTPKASTSTRSHARSSSPASTALVDETDNDRQDQLDEDGDAEDNDDDDDDIIVIRPSADTTDTRLRAKRSVPRKRRSRFWGVEVLPHEHRMAYLRSFHLEWHVASVPDKQKKKKRAAPSTSESDEATVLLVKKGATQPLLFEPKQNKGKGRQIDLTSSAPASTSTSRPLTKKVKLQLREPCPGMPVVTPLVFPKSLSHRHFSEVPKMPDDLLEAWIGIRHFLLRFRGWALGPFRGNSGSYRLWEQIDDLDFWNRVQAKELEADQLSTLILRTIMNMCYGHWMATLEEHLEDDAQGAVGRLKAYSAISSGAQAGDITGNNKVWLAARKALEPEVMRSFVPGVPSVDPEWTEWRGKVSELCPDPFVSRRGRSGYQEVDAEERVVILITIIDGVLQVRRDTLGRYTGTLDDAFEEHEAVVDRLEKSLEKLKVNSTEAQRARYNLHCLKSGGIHSVRTLRFDDPLHEAYTITIMAHSGQLPNGNDNDASYSDSITFAANPEHLQYGVIIHRVQSPSPTSTASPMMEQLPQETSNFFISDVPRLLDYLRWQCRYECENATTKLQKEGIKAAPEALEEALKNLAAFIEVAKNPQEVAVAERERGSLHSRLAKPLAFLRHSRQEEAIRATKKGTAMQKALRELGGPPEDSESDPEKRVKTHLDTVKLLRASRTGRTLSRALEKLGGRPEYVERDLEVSSSDEMEA